MGFRGISQFPQRVEDTNKNAVKQIIIIKNYKSNSLSPFLVAIVNIQPGKNIGDFHTMALATELFKLNRIIMEFNSPIAAN